MHPGNTFGFPLPPLFPSIQEASMLSSMFSLSRAPFFNPSFPFPFFPCGFPPQLATPSEKAPPKETNDATTQQLPPKETLKETETKQIQKEEIPEEKINKNEKNAEKNALCKNDGIHRILKYFIENIGRTRSDRLNEERDKYLDEDPQLLHLFDLVMKKFLMSNKTKEEKIKYILRKAFKYLGKKLKTQLYFTKSNLNKKEFDQIFNDFYMSGKKMPTETDAKNHYKLVFTKEAFNKTMNLRFLNTIFSKEGFVEDYKEFLGSFKEISSRDNEEKLRKAVQKLSSMKNILKINDLSHRLFKRMPWLEVWIEEAEMIAKRLPETNSNFLGLFHKNTLCKKLKNDKIKGKDEENDEFYEVKSPNSLKRKRAFSL